MDYASFKKYSKNGAGAVVEIPADLPQGPDQIECAEKIAGVDPWESGERHVAGISLPNGYWATEPRNEAGGFLLGACPNRDTGVEALLHSSEIIRLLELTAANQIDFASPVANVSPKLLPGVIEDRESLMGLAIQQALAGPATLAEWKGKLVAERHRSHLQKSPEQSQ